MLVCLCAIKTFRLLSSSPSADVRLFGTSAMVLFLLILPSFNFMVSLPAFFHVFAVFEVLVSWSKCVAFLAFFSSSSSDPRSSGSLTSSLFLLRLSFCLGPICLLSTFSRFFVELIVSCSKCSTLCDIFSLPSSSDPRASASSIRSLFSLVLSLCLSFRSFLFTFFSPSCLELFASWCNFATSLEDFSLSASPDPRSFRCSIILFPIISLTSSWDFGWLLFALTLLFIVTLPRWGKGTTRPDFLVVPSSRSSKASTRSILPFLLFLFKDVFFWISLLSPEPSSLSSSPEPEKLTSTVFLVVSYSSRSPADSLCRIGL